MKISKISGEVKEIFKKTAKKLSGTTKREYIATITIELLDGNARKAERVFGWGRATVKKGMRELATGIKCIDNYSARGNKKTEEKIPQLVDDIRAIADPKSQALIDEKGYTDDELPCENTIGYILNRLGYRLKRIQKTKPLKKIPETDAIFENVNKVNRQADESQETLRISIDTKAKVNIGDFSRNGKTREKEPENALDHDFVPDTQLVPSGIFEPTNDVLTIIFGTSIETSDFIVDCLEQWWEENKERLSHIGELVINLDNGPHINSHRTQFTKG